MVHLLVHVSVSSSSALHVELRLISPHISHRRQLKVLILFCFSLYLVGFF